MNAPWLLPQDLLTESIRIMRPHGRRGHEGLALWLGQEARGGLEITHVVDVQGPGFMTSALYMSLTPRAMIVLTALAARLERFLMGQIHSHPRQLLELSELDKRHGLRVPGYLSLVCPEYAQRDLAGFHQCGVHWFDEGQYRRLSNAEISQRLQVTTARVSVLKCEVPR